MPAQNNVSSDARVVVGANGEGIIYVVFVSVYSLVITVGVEVCCTQMYGYVGPGKLQRKILKDEKLENRCLPEL